MNIGCLFLICVVVLFFVKNSSLFISCINIICLAGFFSIKISCSSCAIFFSLLFLCYFIRTYCGRSLRWSGKMLLLLFKLSFITSWIYSVCVYEKHFKKKKKIYYIKHLTRKLLTKKNSAFCLNSLGTGLRNQLQFWYKYEIHFLHKQLGSGPSFLKVLQNKQILSVFQWFLSIRHWHTIYR